MPATILIKKSIMLDCLEKISSRFHYAEIFYAMKANSDSCVLEILHEAGAGFEVASIEEFSKLLDIGVKLDKIICGLPVKGPKFVDELYSAGCRYFVFDHILEFETLLKYAPKAKKILRLFISDLDQMSFRYGMSLEEIHKCKENIPYFFDEVDGLTFHISGNYRSKNIPKVFDRVDGLLAEFNSSSPLILNIGGGYRDQLPLHLSLKYNLKSYYKLLDKHIRYLKDKYNLIFYCEPGRSIVETSGYLQSEALFVKDYKNSIDVFLELNIGKVPGAHPLNITVIHEKSKESIYDLSFHMNRDDEDQINCNFIDTVCEYQVFYSLPIRRPIKQGELLEFEGLGAYTTCLSSNFHSRHFPIVRAI